MSLTRRSIAVVSLALLTLFPCPAHAGFVPGDCDADGDVDLDDHSILATCLTGPNHVVSPPCVCMDFNGDGDVDAIDALGHALMFTGSPGFERAPSHPRMASAQLHLNVTSEGSNSITAAPGEDVAFEVAGTLSDDLNEGLAFVLFDLVFTGGDTLAVDAPTEAPMTSFQIPQGITNPGDVCPPLCGFGGTVIGGDLIQVGGGQNVISNTVDNAPFPIGTVLGGVAHPPGGDLIATGTVTMPTVDGTYTLSVHPHSVAASVIRLGETCMQNPSFFCQTEAVSPGDMVDLTLVVSSVDCNNNGVPDAADIASRTSRDCNENTVPDECDIADQTSRDDFPAVLGGDGVPDECQMRYGQKK